jgi:hypothetical protein
MQGMESYSKAATERAMKVQEVILRGEEDHVVASGGDHRHRDVRCVVGASAMRSLGFAGYSTGDGASHRRARVKIACALRCDP